MNFKTIYQKLFFPYKLSADRAIYEQVAKKHHLSPNRVYQLAHGSSPYLLEEERALNDPALEGIV